MHHTQLKSAVAKYKDYPADELKSALLGDEKKYTDEEISEIITAIDNSKEKLQKGGDEKNNTSNVDKSIAEKQANHPKYKWFDEFEARIQKRELINPYTRQRETIIVKWELGKKLHPKFIEPASAKAMNHFADSADTNGIFKFLVPKDTKNVGDIIWYEDWAKEDGRDFENDINIILKDKK